MGYEIFTYAKLRSELKSQENVIESKEPPVQAFIDVDFARRTVKLKDFFILSYIGSDIPATNYSMNEGWKFHIALDDTDKDNIEIAWDLTKDILIEYKVRMAKIIRPGIKLAEVEGQEGKQITIYTWYNAEKSPEEWHSIMVNISSMLKENNIKPAPRAGSSSNLEDFALKTMIISLIDTSIQMKEEQYL